jgi:YidC/Oxa1 family membrane protein insertase
VSFLLWTEYNETYGEPTVAPVQSSVQNQQTQDLGIPSASNQNSSIPAPTISESTGLVPQASDVQQPVMPEAVTNTDNILTVETDTFSAQINLIGGDIIKAHLKKFPITQGSDDSYPLLKPEDALLHVARSGLIGADGTDTAQGRPRYQAQATSYTLDGDSLMIPLTWQSDKGVKVTKTYTFNRDSHTIQLDYLVENNKNETATVQQYGQLVQTTNEVEGSSMFMPIYRGTAYSTSDDRFEKLAFNDIQGEKLNKSTVGGWAAMIEHYFVAAWVPPQDQTNTIQAVTYQNNYAVILFKGETVAIPANSSATLSSQLYVGPKDQDTLADLAENLNYTVDYGILWFISDPLFALLQWLHSFLGNWGLAIIMITLIVKGAMYWLTKKQYESMAKMRALAPKITALNDRFGDDRQKKSQAMMELYKKEKVNPMGGCFPVLLQMPIFLALYWVLLESVELRHADFVFWITDLSIPDPWFVLPILTAFSMYLLQRLQPMTIQDPLQQKLLQYMPVAMGVFFFFFPAGLVLYWLISNLVTLTQAKIIYASMEKRGMKVK